MKCRAFFGRCGDPRIRDAANNLLNFLGFAVDEVFVYSRAGGIGNKKDLTEEIKFVQSELSPEAIILTSHQDCKKGTGRDILERSVTDIRDLFPCQTVRGFWIMLDGTWEEVLPIPQAAIAA